MGLLLVVLGIVIWLLVSPIIGIILIVIGLLLFFVPLGGPWYGYSHWRGRRPPP